MVTFRTVEHRRPLTGTKLYCLVTEAHVCEQPAHLVFPVELKKTGVNKYINEVNVSVKLQFIEPIVAQPLMSEISTTVTHADLSPVSTTRQHGPC